MLQNNKQVANALNLTKQAEHIFVVKERKVLSRNKGLLL